ncbi:MAG: hypothetical protein ACXVDH_00775 [Nocardioides sp.]
MIASAVALAVIVAVGVIVGARAWHGAHRSSLERALDLAPKDAARYSWTDWAALRTALGVSGTGTEADDALLDKGYDADLTPASSITSSVDTLREAFGFSPATMSSELLTQSTTGAALFITLDDSVSFDAIRAHLSDAGFAPPSSDQGVWDGGDVAGVGPVPILGFAALDASAHLVVTSDSAGFLRDVMAHRGDGDVPAPIAQVAAQVGSPIAAELYDGDYTCSHLAMANADATDQAQGEQLIADAGKVNPVLAFAMARTAHAVRVAMAFADHDQAKANAATRARLASGDAPGQGGTFPDRFALGVVAARGAVVTMDLKPVADSPVLSDLSTGPLLFATC